MISGFILIPLLAGPDNSGTAVFIFWIVSSPLVFFYSRKLNRQINS